MSASPNPFDFSQYTVPVTTPTPAGPANGTGAAQGPVRDLDPGTGVEYASALRLDAARPPVVWIAAAAAAALLGLAGALVLGLDVRAALVAWLLSGPVAIGLLAVFTMRDTAQRAKSLYTAPSWVTAAYWMTMATSLAGVVVAALHIADWVGRHW